MRIIKNKKPTKVRVGDEILGAGTVTEVLPGPRFATDTGYTCLQFPADFDVPVFSRRRWVHA